MTSRSPQWDRVKQIFQDALERPREERAVFLGDTCRDDTALRAAVESLLVAHQDAGSFAQRPAIEMFVSSDPGVTGRDSGDRVLQKGDRLGSYEIAGWLGAGGMGEVYRATDTHLKRAVAIKVLPNEFAVDPERLARFKREAEVLASLNHPNIAAIYEVEESNGAPALILELVEGETLASQLAGPQSAPLHDRPTAALPIPDALEIARQIADALEAAHEKGIVHRDLKPANIKITVAGVVKILDFGLARAVTHDNAGQDVSPASLTGLSTSAGALLGTASYMSPEQARGRTVDKRTDIWAFGCVLFEMLTGQRAFEGEDVALVLSKVLQQDPDFDALPAALPAHVSQTLRSCLRKSLKERAPDIGAVRLALEGAFAAPVARSKVAGSAGVSGKLGRLQMLPWVLLAVLMSVLGGAMLGWLAAGKSAGARAVSRLQMQVLPADQLAGSYSSARPSRTALAISPDGRRVVFTGRRGTVTQLYMRSLDEVAATPIQGTEGAIGPFFSPDGAWVGFWADNSIKKVGLAGGPPSTIAEAPGVPGVAGGLFGASWGNDNSIFFRANSDAISRVSSTGGRVSTVTTAMATRGERHLLPHVLPGGKALLFTVQTDNDWAKASVVLRVLDTGEQRVLIQGGADARYVSSGHLVFMKTGTLMAVPFDLASLQVTGAPAALIDDVMQAVSEPNASDETGAGQFAVSASGTLVYLAGGVHPPLESSLVWVDRTGGPQPLPGFPVRAFYSPRLSPDGRKVAVIIASRVHSAEDLWVYDVVRGAPIRLTFGGINHFPVWSPDGTRLVYGSESGGVSSLYVVNANGSGKPERLATGEPSSWSAVGNLIALLEGNSRTRQAWILPLENDRKPRLLLESRFSPKSPEFSPDGRWLAYVSRESGANEVYVRPYPGPGEKIRVSTDGGTMPIWTANGREILYRLTISDRIRFFSSAVISLAPFRIDAPRLLFEANAGEYGDTQPVRGWDASADGQRLLLTKRVESTKPVSDMQVVLNWTEELKRLVPTH